MPSDVPRTGRAHPGEVDHAELFGSDFFKQYEPELGSEAYRLRQAMYRQEFPRVTRYVSAGRVLDVGAGFGDFLALFDPTRWERYATEPAPIALEVLRSRGIATTLPERCDGSFDLIILRGTIHHMDEPLGTLKQCIRWLRPGGVLAFLATPNIGSVSYRLFQEMPMLDPPRNFMLVSDRILQRILQNLGMDVLRFEYPYRGTPYAHPVRDLGRFLLRLVGVRRPFAFWGNMLECYARKPGLPAGGPP